MTIISGSLYLSWQLGLHPLPLPLLGLSFLSFSFLTFRLVCLDDTLQLRVNNLYTTLEKKLRQNTSFRSAMKHNAL